MTIAIGGVTLTTFGSVVFMPRLLQVLDRSALIGESLVWLHLAIRYGAAFVVLTLLHAPSSTPH